MCGRRSPTTCSSAQFFRLGVDEVLQIIFNEIDHPSAFILVCRRFNALSRDPYVRAHYFLARYGSVQALYWALGRGKIITEQVLDVSGPFFLVVTPYMRVQSSGTGSAEQRSTYLPLPRPNRRAPLLSFCLSFYQDTVGSDLKLGYLEPLLEAIVGEIWHD